METDPGSGTAAAPYAPRVSDGPPAPAGHDAGDSRSTGKVGKIGVRHDDPVLGGLSNFFTIERPGSVVRSQALDPERFAATGTVLA